MWLTIVACLGLLAGGCARSAGFVDEVAAARAQAAALRSGFVAVAPLEPAQKGPALRKTVEAAGKPLLARLTALKAPADHAACAADALGGARRSVGAMEDMVELYDAGGFDDLFGARIVASARNADEGLTTVEERLRDCSR